MFCDVTRALRSEVWALRSSAQALRSSTQALRDQTRCCIAASADLAGA